MKNYVLLLIFSFLIVSCKVDPKDAIGIDKIETIKVPVTTKTIDIKIVEKVWDTTYVIDLKENPKLSQYIDKVKSVKLNAINYNLSEYKGDGIVDSGKISLFISDLAPEDNVHLSFTNDVSTKAIYKMNNIEKLTKSQQILNDTKKLTIKVVVDLDKAPIKPVSFGFDFNLDLDLLVNLAEL